MEKKILMTTRIVNIAFSPEGVLYGVTENGTVWTYHNKWIEVTKSPMVEVEFTAEANQ